MPVSVMPDLPLSSPPLTHQEAIAFLRALPREATAMLVGASDTGKTTFAREAVTALMQSGRSVAIVDCDLGQSEIGPPGTIGVALAEKGAEPPRALRDLPLLAAYFVGATSPAHHALEVCVGACQMARVAKKRRPDLILVDTCGLVQGRAGARLKRCKAELLLPQTVLAFARGGELDPLLRAFAHLQSPEIRRVVVASEAVRKTPAARATRRAARFLAAFRDARDISLSWDEVALFGTALGEGLPVPHHLQQWLGQTLRLPVLHAEQRLPEDGGALLVVVNGERWDSSGLAAVENYFRTSQVFVVPARKFARLLVGLVNASGAFLDIGLIQRIDFPHRTLTVHTVCRKPGAVAQVWMGALRLRPDGKELGETRPGEL